MSNGSKPNSKDSAKQNAKQPRTKPKEVLLTLRKVCVGYGGPAVLDGVDLRIHPGERVCLLGRNGEGKSTLLKLLNEELLPDSGSVVRAPGVVVTRLVQEVPEDVGGRVYDLVAAGLGLVGDSLRVYHDASVGLLTRPDDAGLLADLARAQHQIELLGGWDAGQRIDRVILELKLPEDAEFSVLSGGLKRRVLLAQALVCDPDILLLDEPTNHLDIEAITWMETFLLRFPKTLIFVSHDRVFLKKLATRIVELDRGVATSWPGDYNTYVERKSAALDVEATHNRNFDKKLAREETWIRQGIKARRTRNEGRVRALKKLRAERSKRRDRLGSVTMQASEAQRSGKLVISAENVSYTYDGNPLVNGFSTTVMRGDRIGVIGPNGSGKTTLLRLLLGTLTPQSGQLELGANLEVAYFDQMRDQLNDARTVADNVADGNDTVTINGSPKHIIGYLKDFLFSPDRARSPVSVLSGGERNRLLLAKLFTKPSNVLVLDEPTNDLDAETLERLEDLLFEYPGTVLLVSHDRAFLNSVVTSTLVFEEDGQVGDYVGGYDDWVRQRSAARPVAVSEKPKKPKNGNQPKPSKPRKLSFKETRQLEALPLTIETLESEQAKLFESMADPNYYQRSREAQTTTSDRLALIESELETNYARWEALEEIQSLAE